MLTLPFLSAIILARDVDWLILPAALAVVAAFSVREPLVVLGRQSFVWREPRAESRLALRFLAGNLMILAASGVVLLARRDWRMLSLLGISASVLVGLAVVMTVLNRQRSVSLQLVSAVGLSSSALVAWLSAQPRLEPTAWWVWIVHSAYSAAAVLVVHARLGARVAARQREQRHEWVQSFRWALAAQVVLLLGGALHLVCGRFLLALPLALAAAVHLAALMRLRRPVSHTVPFRRIGLRALALSIAFSALVVIALW
ncbi:MAG: hypothetical protein KIT09_16400 [Bryobacteraceae bacterium]|nr:hypothetical protein [Bryobacteraceae bacterium]